MAQNGLKIDPGEVEIQIIWHKHTFSEPYGSKECAGVLVSVWIKELRSWWPSQEKQNRLIRPTDADCSLNFVPESY